MAEKFGDVKTFGDAGNYCSRRLFAGLEEIISRSDSRSASESTRRVACGLKAELLRRVGVQQVRLQHAILDDNGAPGRDAFAVEGRGAEASDHGAIVDHGDMI